MPKTMTLEQCAVRMTAFLARKARRKPTRAYLDTLPPRPPVFVTPNDYARQDRAAKDAERYAAWVARGKSPSPPAKPTKRHPKARERDPAFVTLMERIHAAQGGFCAGCGMPLVLTDDLDDPMRQSFDHVVPKARGGVNESNLVAMHRVCNGAKADRAPTGCEMLMLVAVNAALGGDK